MPEQPPISDRSPMYTSRIRFGRDAGERMTLGELANRLAEAIEADSSYQTFENVFDELFLVGCYDNVFELLKAHGHDHVSFRRDLGGLVLSMYLRGGSRQRTKEG